MVHMTEKSHDVCRNEQLKCEKTQCQITHRILITSMFLFMPTLLLYKTCAGFYHSIQKKTAMLKVIIAKNVLPKLFVQCIV